MSFIIIAHNIRSTYNVGSILRSADGFGVDKIYFTGYTPYPILPNDTRLPHVRDKTMRQIHKTALGAETSVPYEYIEAPQDIITSLRAEGYVIGALEQAPKSVLLNSYQRPQQFALLLGEEVNGVSAELLSMCDVVLEIPMHGLKESFNVSVAAGIAFYALTLKVHEQQIGNSNT